MTVADVDFIGAPHPVDGTNNVAVKGRSSGLALADIAVEFRRDKPDPRFRRGPFVPVSTATPGEWEATFRPSTTNSAEGLTPQQQHDIALNEAAWSAVVDNVTETTLAELGEAAGVAAGCTGSADPNAIAGGYTEPVNINSGDVTLSGTAKEGVAAVSVTVGALDPKDATLSTNATGVKTWTLTVTKTELATLPDGNVTITSSFDGLAGATRTMLKDTVAPGAPTATPLPGTYAGTQNVALNKPTGEGLSKIYWEIGAGTAANDPDQFSGVYTTQIPVSASQTIKARVIDPADNQGPIGTFTYRIGTPPPAPASLTAAEVNGGVRLTWPAVSAATGGYNVYLVGGTQPLNGATPVPAGTTSYTHQSGLGTHSYVVRAIEGNGVESSNSPEATATVAPPGVPQGFRVTEGNAQVRLDWTSQTDAANFRVYRDGAATPIQTVAGTATSYTNTALTNGTTYEYAVSAVDAAGNESDKTGVLQATPNPPADTTAPTLTARTPAIGATGVAATSNVTATFGEEVQGVDTASFTLRAQGATADIPATVTRNGTTNQWVLNPDADLAASTQYTVTLTGGAAAIRDLASNPLANATWTFTTSAAPDTTVPTVTARSPLAGATGVAIASNVTATFSEAVQGVGTGTFTLRAEGSATNVVATLTQLAGSNQWVLDPAANLAGSTQYTATLTGGATNIRDTANNALTTASWTFTTAASDTTAPTVTERVPASAATGVPVANDISATFSEAVQGVSGTTFTLRTTTGSTTNIAGTVSQVASTNQWVLNPSANLAANTQYTATLTGGAASIRDGANNALATTSWTFTTAAAAATDTTAPTVTARVPAVNATGVAVGSDITATFSEAVQAVGSGTFTLRATTGSTTNIAGAVTQVAGTNQYVLNPTNNLAANTQYTATLTGGATAIRDNANNALANVSWTFSTGAAAATDTTAPTIATRNPVNGQIDVSVTTANWSSIYNVTFSENVQGVSNTTVKLQRITSALGATTVTLDPTAVPATVSFDAATRVARLVPSANLAQDTRYRMTVTGGATAIRDLAGNPLATTTVDFTTGPRPTLSARTPAVNATAVSRTANVTATFNEAVTGVSNTTVTLRSVSGTTVNATPVTATVTYNATTRVATLDPSATLAANTRYQMTFTTGVRDTAGNAVNPSLINWQFTTGA